MVTNIVIGWCYAPKNWGAYFQEPLCSRNTTGTRPPLIQTKTNPNPSQPQLHTSRDSKLAQTRPPNPIRPTRRVLTLTDPRY